MSNTAETASIPPIAELVPYASKILQAAQASQNEEQLKIETEDILKTLCSACGILQIQPNLPHNCTSCLIACSHICCKS